MADLQACFDFHVRSEIELPELGPALDGVDRPVVGIVRGPVPCSLGIDDGDRPVFLEYDGHRALLSVPEVARFLIDGTSTIVVDPVDGVSPNSVRLFLLGSAMGIVGHLRGLLLLHANAVVLKGRAFAFAGHSGAGKSTLAGQFARAGYAMLCDDVCAVRFADDGVPMAWPGVPRLKLWREAADALGHQVEEFEQVGNGIDKFSVPLGRPASGACPLARIYELAHTEPGSEPSTERLQGGAAMALIMEHTYRPEYLPVLGLTAQNFALAARLARVCEVFRLQREWGYEAFDSEFARLCGHLQAIPMQ